MSTNIDRAAEIIREADRKSAKDPDVMRYGGPDEHAQVLADNGLLMPDLPEPDNSYPEWLVGGASISPGPDTGEVAIEWEDREDTGRGTITRVQYLTTDQALALLAAANYIERNQE